MKRFFALLVLVLVSFAAVALAIPNSSSKAREHRRSRTESHFKTHKALNKRAKGNKSSKAPSGSRTEMKPEGKRL